MIEKDKETEFSGEGLEGEKNKILNEESFPAEEVENSQAADQESVTKNAKNEDPSPDDPQITSETDIKSEKPSVHEAVPETVAEQEQEVLQEEEQKEDLLLLPV